jgi:hypothetical protein
VSSFVLVAAWCESNKQVRLIQTYNRGSLCTTRLYNIKNKTNARVGTAARFCACKSRTVAQKLPAGTETGQTKVSRGLPWS